MADIKKILTSLSKFFNLLLDCDLLNPDIFKSAKFNTDEQTIVPIFWTLLQKISQTCDPQNVKVFLASFNYKNIQFYSLSPNANNSRELLLALAFLIGKTDILIILIKDKISKSLLSQEFNKIDVLNPENHLFNATFNTLEEYYNYLLLLIGKIDKNLKLCSEFNDKTLKIVAKVHKDSNNTKQLTIAELNNIKKPELMKKYLKDIKLISDILEHYFDWKSHEGKFWDWCITVVHLKENCAIDLDNLKIFLKYLRAFLKVLLTKNTVETSDQKQIEFFRVFYQDKMQDTLKINYKYQENSLQQLEIEGNKSLEEICAFLQKIIRA